MVRRLLAAATLLELLLALTPAVAAHAAAPARTVHVRAHSPLKTAPAPRRSSSETATPAAVTAGGYIPCDIWNAYHMGPLDRTAGLGQTIAIIDPYSSGSLTSDFLAFSSLFGLATDDLRIDSGLGPDNTQPDAAGWIPEITLDVEWAHAVAPGAQIVLVEAKSSVDADMLAAIDRAVQVDKADVVSMSWTFSESSLPSGQEQTWDAHFPATNGAGVPVSYVAAAGDAGFEVNWPATSPHVVAVGGTSVAPAAFGYATNPGPHDSCAPTLSPGVNATNETVWGTATGSGVGTGGGVSVQEPEPAYQSSAGLALSGRGTPDVAILADPNTGVAVFLQGAWSATTFGGTSLGSPLWAAIIARRNLVRTSNLSDVGWVYGAPASDYNDIITGASTPSSSSACVTATSCVAKPGYDLVTGRGSTTDVPDWAYGLYFSWFDRLSDPGFQNDNIHVVNPGTTPARVSVAIPGCAAQTGSIDPGKETYFTCPGGFGGPVVVRASQKVIASQRVQYNQTFNEVRGLPASAASQHLVFPWFDRASSPGFTDDNIHVVNPGTAPASVTFSIPGCAAQQATIQPGQETYKTCPGGIGGPVKVDSNQPVLATQRVKYYGSFNETPALPAAGEANSLWLTWFDKTSDPGFLNDNVHVVGAPGVRVHADIPTCGDQAATLDSTGGTYFSCRGGIGGPVRIFAEGGANISASQRVQYYQSFNEVPATGLPDAGASLWLSWFDRVSDAGFTTDNVHLINIGTAPAVYSVVIPRCAPQGGTLNPSEETFVTCALGFGGPVQVVSSTPGAELLASARVKYYSSFNEVTAST